MKSNPLADEILGFLREDDTDDFPVVPHLPVLKVGEEPSPIFDELFEYQPRTGRGNSLAKAAERSELRKDLLGDDIDALPKPARLTLSLARRTTQLVSQTVDAVFHKVQHISASAPARKARIAEIIDETKQALEDRGYRAAAWDGWNKLHQSCEESIVSVLMET